MKKLIWAVLLSSGMITLPSHAGEAQFLYQATATNSDSGAPIEGVVFNWTFIDKVSNVTSINTCVTNVDGTCEVKLIAQTGTFSGPNVIGQAVATKDGYDKDVEYQWQQYGNQRFLMARLKAK